MIKTLGPATGTARWLQRPDDRAENGVLTIDGVPYLLSPVRKLGAVRIKDRPIIGWRIAKADGTIYDLSPAAPCWVCDCPDYVFSRSRAETPSARECKHCRGLRAALKAEDIGFESMTGDPTDCRIDTDLDQF